MFSHSSFLNVEKVYSVFKFNYVQQMIPKSDISIKYMHKYVYLHAGFAKVQETSFEATANA